MCGNGPDMRQRPADYLLEEAAARRWHSWRRGDPDPCHPANDQELLVTLVGTVQNLVSRVTALEERDGKR